MILWTLAALICAANLSHGQSLTCILAQELNQCCHKGDEWPGDKPGSGNRGPPKDQSIVDYAVIEEMVKTAVNEAIQQHRDAARNVTSDTWKVFQRRQDGSVDFYRTWDEYVEGFGEEDGEFWLGLEDLHQLTKKGKYQLRIDLEDLGGEKRWAQYDEFYVGPAEDYYRLKVSGYCGTAGDALLNPWPPKDAHNEMKFTTWNSDNDSSEKANCAKEYKGGWWYNDCYAANLNGIYYHGYYFGAGADGIVWKPWTGLNYSLKFVEMKLRRAP